MSNSKLVNHTKLSPNCDKPRKSKIDTITIHHMAGNMSIEACGNLFADKKREVSANYGVGTDGRIALYVDENNRSWCTANADNDNRAITIEVANDVIGGNWHVSDKALASTINLCADICKRNGIKKLNYTGDKKGNLTMHKWFAATACPGAYLESKFSYIASEVNKKLSSAKPAINPIVKEFQQAMVADGHKCTVDGIWSSACDKLADNVYVGFNESGIRKNKSKNLAKLAQKRLKALGYDIGSAGVDGIIGKMGKSAIMKYQKNTVKCTADGIFGKLTWRKLLNVK